MARQHRMQIDDRDYYLDLLFYHRKLRRLIAIDLKLGKFEAADKGQMELYLGWLKRYACEPDEAEPLGMILCAGKSEEHIALLEMQKSGIHVASYWTDALPRKELERKLHEAVRLARARLETNKGLSAPPNIPYENLSRRAALLIISGNMRLPILIAVAAQCSVRSVRKAAI